MDFENSSLFKRGKKLATGRGLKSMGEKSYKYKWNDRNSILEVEEPSDINSRWNIYERQMIQSAKPASYYHQTAIAHDIANVKKRRG
jgi:hypothetical protein